LTECGKLLPPILKAQTQGELATKFKTFFIPLTVELYRVLERHDTSPKSQPSSDFLRLLVELCLHGVLGAKPSVVRQVPAARVGCGCDECNALDKFIFSPEPEQTFRFLLALRAHLGTRLEKVPDLCTFTTLRNSSPHGLQVTKHPEIVATYRWQQRQVAANKFLEGLDWSVLSGVMGSRFADVRRAFDGSEPFVLSPNPGAQKVPKTSSPTSASATTSNAAVAPGQPHSSAVTGKKRKKAERKSASVTIDLT
jgi:hypothetical protein